LLRLVEVPEEKGTELGRSEGGHGAGLAWGSW
jgi:hypothetical protein